MPRLQCVDMLRGIVMLLMVLDHTREFFTGSSILPEDIPHTSGALFVTRFISYFCAPAFFLLAGVGERLMLSRGKSVPELSRYLWTRGLWLIFLDVTLLAYAWTNTMPVWYSGVLWALGWSMIFMAVLVRLPISATAAVGCGMIVGHNLLDQIPATAFGRFAGMWMILHGHGWFHVSGHTSFFVLWPLIPWAGVMAAGYALGALVLQKNWHKPVFISGVILTAAFFMLRLFHLYGNSDAHFAWYPGAAGPWRIEPNITLTLVSFFDTLKYPPSLQFLLMTMGPLLMALVYFDKIDGSTLWARILETYGRVPLAFYVVHLFVIRNLAVWTALIYKQKSAWILYGGPVIYNPPLGYGHGLPFIYMMWIAILVLLYPACRWFGLLKQRHWAIWWLRYL